DTERVHKSARSSRPQPDGTPSPLRPVRPAAPALSDGPTAARAPHRPRRLSLSPVFSVACAIASLNKDFGKLRKSLSHKAVLLICAEYLTPAAQSLPNE